MESKFEKLKGKGKGRVIHSCFVSFFDGVTRIIRGTSRKLSKFGMFLSISVNYDRILQWWYARKYIRNIHIANTFESEIILHLYVIGRTELYLKF